MQFQTLKGSLQTTTQKKDMKSQRGVSNPQRISTNNFNAEPLQFRVIGFKPSKDLYKLTCTSHYPRTFFPVSNPQRISTNPRCRCLNMVSPR
ncbi:MAG: hypothetical protein MjAS7_1971 [Metallosphaera javensis (ex Sakai et al. 2022)]|nr:MAG: hypothetical protein MjAS7_1971 [Metallosphaera javensis (ex Sakai et al. 2022)]